MVGIRQNLLFTVFILIYAPGWGLGGWGGHAHTCTEDTLPIERKIDREREEERDRQSFF